MASGQNSATFQHIRTLFNVGAIGGLSDRQLLERLEQRGSEGAELAFTALVERHGPMVLRVCRSVLSDPNDADDAFQATFLVLVRRAGSLWVHDSLGPWLHQVAHRTAVCARSAAARRWRHEEAASVRASRFAGADVEAHDLGEVLHGEVSRLPDHYRVVIVLCLLEGLTHAQAAGRLGWPAGTVQSRLARGKALLRDRLTRRGLAPCALVLGGLVSSDAAAATLSPALVGATIRTATLFSADGAAIPVSITRLANQVVNAMLILRLKAVLTSLLTAALVLGAGVYMAMQASGQAHPAAKDGAEAVDPQGQTRGLDADRSPLVAPRDLKARAGRGTLLLYALDKDVPKEEPGRGRRRQRADGRGGMMGGMMGGMGGRAARKGRSKSQADIEKEQKDGQRIDPRGNEISREVTVETHWVVITGALDHHAVRERLRRGRGEDSIEVHPDYRRTELERQELAPGADRSAWSKVDRDKNCRILRHMSEEEEERTPGEVRIAALVDPLPFLKAGVWEGVDIERLIPLGKVKVELPDQGLTGRGTRLPFETTDAPEIMVRALDFTVVPGFHYRYRVRIVIDGSDGVGQRREVFGPWSEPTAEVAVTE